MSNKETQNQLFKRIIILLSVAIPLVVAILYYVIPKENAHLVEKVSFLPKLNAIFNTAVSVLLVLALYFIKKGDIKKHKTAMLSAFVCSALFLVSYVIYHFIAPSTSFGGEGFIRYIYYFILISHIILAAVVLPFILFSFYFGLSGQTEKHKKLSKITWPMWLYVSVTGVLVYLMIAPYYA